jgi:type I restriction enzyme S subunit
VKSGTPLLALYGATAGVAAITSVSGAINQAILAMVPHRIEAEYLFQWLRAHREQIIDRYTQGGQPNLSGAIIRSIELPLPPPSEQKKVAAALRDADDLIATLERLIAKKQVIKQGMMQQLLTGRIRLSGFTQPWHEVPLEDLARIVSGGTPKSSVPSYWDGDVPWCTPTDITREPSRFLRRTERTISREGLEHSSAQLLPIGSLLLCTRATVGEVKIATTRIATNQGFKSLVPRESVSEVYLYYKLLTLKDALAAKGTGSTFLEISRRDVASLRLLVPGRCEQDTIANVLSNVDDEIEKLEQRLTKAKAVKTGMMQELLTGRTRLPAEEAAA